MIGHILVPLDGSALAESVLPAASALAGVFGARVTLLHIVEERPPETVHGQPHLADADGAQTYLEAVAGRPLFEGRRVEVHVHRPQAADVAASVVDHAHELEADLVVLSTHGRSGVRGFLFGSIAVRALQRGTAPILLVNPTETGEAPPFACRTILVPLDGTAAHEPALGAASALGRAWKAALHLVMVVPTVGTLSGDEAASGVFMPLTKRALLDLAERGAAEYVLRLAESLSETGLPATGHVGRGDPATALIEAAGRVGANLVVMASHAKAGLDAFWSGSLTPRLMEKLRCPILLVRAIARQ
jgi:nucleotide-binding universal stress UspA family protein